MGAGISRTERLAGVLVENIKRGRLFAAPKSAQPKRRRVEWLGF